MNLGPIGLYSVAGMGENFRSRCSLQAQAGMSESAKKISLKHSENFAKNDSSFAKAVKFGVKYEIQVSPMSSPEPTLLKTLFLLSLELTPIN